MNNRSLVACVICGLLLHAIASCDHRAETGSAAEDTSDSVLRRGNGGEPQTLDPYLAEDVHAFNVLYDLYEGLVIEGPDGSILPGVAENWEISDDGHRYTFHLRADARWSNGEPVVADDFVAGITRGVSPNSISPYSFLLAPIANAVNVIEGRVPADKLGIRAENSRTVVIELESPANHILDILAMPVAFPLYGGENFDVAQFRKPDRFVGNGPYVLDQWLPLERIRLRKNQNYRAADTVAMRTVDYYPIVDPNTELSMYRAGELDITATVPTGRIAGLRDERPDELRIAPSLGIYYIAFDLSEPPLNDKKLRQALSMAIDRDAVVAVLARGESPAFGVVPPGVAAHVAATYTWRVLPPAEREKEARKMYVDAGFDVDNPLQLSLIYDTGDIHETVALAVSSMWRDVLGAQISLEKREWKHFLATRDNRSEWQAMRFAWFGDYNDASTFTEIFRSDNPQNLSGFQSKKYDEILDEAAVTVDAGARTDLLSNAERLLIDEYPIAPLYFFVSKHLVRTDIENFQTNVLDRHPSQFLRKRTGQSQTTAPD